MTESEASFAVVPVIVGAGTIASILYLGVGARTVTPGVSGQYIPLATFIWRTVPCFLVSVYWSHIMWVGVMDVDILGLIYGGVRDGTVAYGISGDILCWPRKFR